MIESTCSKDQPSFKLCLVLVGQGGCPTRQGKLHELHIHSAVALVMTVLLGDGCGLEQGGGIAYGTKEGRLRILQHNCHVESEADVEGLPRPWSLFDELRAADRGAGSSSEEDEPREGDGPAAMNSDSIVDLASAVSAHQQSSFPLDQQSPGAELVYD